MAGVSGDPGTTAQDGVSGKTNEIGVPEPVRGNPAESVRDGKKHITVKSIRVKDLSGSGSRNVIADADGDLVIGGSGDEFGFDYDEVDYTKDSDNMVTQKEYYLSSVTQGVETFTYNGYGHIESNTMVVSGASADVVWTYTYESDNFNLASKAKT